MTKEKKKKRKRKGKRQDLESKLRWKTDWRNLGSRILEWKYLVSKILKTHFVASAQHTNAAILAEDNKRSVRNIEKTKIKFISQPNSPANALCSQCFLNFEK